MRAILLRTALIALGVAISPGAAAQFRHDEKPHGQGKASPAPDTPVTERTPGRHDERPHGQRKPKPAAKQAGEKKSPSAPTRQ